MRPQPGMPLLMLPQQRQPLPLLSPPFAALSGDPGARDCPSRHSQRSRWNLPPSSRLVMGLWRGPKLWWVPKSMESTERMQMSPTEQSSCSNSARVWRRSGRAWSELPNHTDKPCCHPSRLSVQSTTSRRRGWCRCAGVHPQAPVFRPLSTKPPRRHFSAGRRTGRSPGTCSTEKTSAGMSTCRRTLPSPAAAAAGGRRWRGRQSTAEAARSSRTSSRGMCRRWHCGSVRNKQRVLHSSR